jgi:hypothetical protein
MKPTSAAWSSLHPCTKKEVSVKPEVVNYLQGTGAAGGFA